MIICTIFRTTDWQDYVRDAINNWYELYHDWMNFGGPIHIMYFGDLQSNPSKELKDLLKFLKMKISSKELLCVLQNFEGRYKRLPLNNKIKTKLYSDSLLRYINQRKTSLINELDFFINRPHHNIIS